MTFVVDASILVAWAFDEVTAVASEARERTHREAAAAPALGWFEVRNPLIQGEHRGSFTRSFSFATRFSETLRLSGGSASKAISHTLARFQGHRLEACRQALGFERVMSIMHSHMVNIAASSYKEQ